MADPVPSLDELVEVAAAKMWEERRAVRLKQGAVILPWERIDLISQEAERAIARAILTAVLPRVVGAAVEALGPFGEYGDNFIVPPFAEDHPFASLCGWVALDATLRDFRRARTVSDQLRALGGG